MDMALGDFGFANGWGCDLGLHPVSTLAKRLWAKWSRRGFFNGMLAPFIAFISALLTFAAFFVQYQANEAQKAALRKQDAQQRIDRFEQRFFEMLKIHRENVENMVILNRSFNPPKEYGRGRASFAILNNEILKLYEIMEYSKRNFYMAFLYPDVPYHKFETAFKMTFWGLPSASAGFSLVKHLPEFFGVDNVSSFSIDICEEKNDNQILALFDLDVDPISNPHRERYPLPIPYQLALGHSAFLSIYFEHLDLMLEFVDSISDVLIPLDKKKGYTSMLLAQLSPEKRKLLFFRSLTEYGEKYWTNDWMRKYELIRNMDPRYIPEDLSPIARMRTYLKKNNSPFDDASLQKYFDFKIL